jgi:hypothetical protein
MKIKPDDHTTDLKDIVFDLLAKKNIAEFTVNFDGSGDSGQIDSIDLPDEIIGEKVAGIKVSDGIHYYSSTGPEQIYDDAKNIGDVIESVCYQVLQNNVCSGWEIDDGSFGEFLFDVKKRKVKLEFNERVTDVNQHEYEF